MTLFQKLSILVAQSKKKENAANLWQQTLHYTILADWVEPCTCEQENRLPTPQKIINHPRKAVCVCVMMTLVPGFAETVT